MKQRFTFEPFYLDDVSGMLWRGTTPLPLTPKAFAVLRFLVSRAGELVGKEVLFEAVWPDTFVGDGVLKTCVREVRKALSDDPRQPHYIETAHRRGYRVRRIGASDGRRPFLLRRHRFTRPAPGFESARALRPQRRRQHRLSGAR
ncbi:MAG: hypothetical protein GEU82_07125 [Luteitalea sp.]|nr:hypothetical protein [Luteitalea sp.]